MSLIIGITPCLFHADDTRTIYNGRPLLYLEQSMSDWVFDGGMVPVILPVPSDLEQLPTWIDRLLPTVDGLLIPGGVDIDPASYGKDSIDVQWPGDSIRDRYERAWINAGFEANVPILGVCRGHQMINVAFGGTLFQDIETQTETTFEHRRADIYEKNVHAASLVPDSQLHQLYDLTSVRINSVHHQAVDTIAPGFFAQAHSHDGLVEAIFRRQTKPTDPYVLGVQWHPEFQDRTDDALLDPMPILQHFKDAIALRQTRS